MFALTPHRLTYLLEIVVRVLSYEDRSKARQLVDEHQMPSSDNGYRQRHQPPARLSNFICRTVSRFDQYGPPYSWRASLAGLPQVIRGLLRDPQIGTASIFHAKPSL